jgi:ABC-type sugar transport system permease subunit
MDSEVLMMNRLQLSPQFGTHEALAEWLSYDPTVRPGLELPKINWNAVMGLTLATVVSGGVWLGIGMMVVRFWK